MKAFANEDESRKRQNLQMTQGEHKEARREKKSTKSGF
jgi:hypothetical protein